MSEDLYPLYPLNECTFVSLTTINNMKYTVQFLCNTMFGVHRKGGGILQRNLILCKVPSCHNMTMLYPNLCYNEVFYKGTVLYSVVIIFSTKK